MAATGDPIAALPVGNPLRTLADGTEFMSANLPDWFNRTLEQAKKQQWQRWWDLRNWQSWSGAVAYARGYLYDQRHTTAYVADGHLQLLAAEVGKVRA
jgi:hypothetical protein